ncbi:SEL1-like repeat protein [Schlegelella sp. S2-27]|uniref:SEL1-like repeat protein n=1 Tax=Caldimonas mangrovi TaxID=2944811 RepID=A0ABT0YJR6_9BURK|nr:SEL1-like repeat protein [Caldimonas mangrovi]MCM5678898.1 SEL1-like repeat protein [Caldimonas mangrovi]
MKRWTTFWFSLVLYAAVLPSTGSAVRSDKYEENQKLIRWIYSENRCDLALPILQKRGASVSKAQDHSFEVSSMGTCLVRMGKVAQALPWLVATSELKGHELITVRQNAFKELAVLYAKGDGVHQDVEKAVVLYLKAGAHREAAELMLAGTWDSTETIQLLLDNGGPAGTLRLAQWLLERQDVHAAERALWRTLGAPGYRSKEDTAAQETARIMLARSHLRTGRTDGLLTALLLLQRGGDESQELLDTAETEIPWDLVLAGADADRAEPRPVERRKEHAEHLIQRASLHVPPDLLAWQLWRGGHLAELSHLSGKRADEWLLIAQPGVRSSALRNLPNANDQAQLRVALLRISLPAEGDTTARVRVTVLAKVDVQDIIDECVVPPQDDEVNDGYAVEYDQVGRSPMWRNVGGRRALEVELHRFEGFSGGGSGHQATAWLWPHEGRLELLACGLTRRSVSMAGNQRPDGSQMHHEYLEEWELVAGGKPTAGWPQVKLVSVAKPRKTVAAWQWDEQAGRYLLKAGHHRWQQGAKASR